MTVRLALILMLLVIAVCSRAQTPASTGAPAQPAEAIIEKSQQAFYTAGADMRAEVSMELVSSSGQRRTRVLTMLRLNVSGGAEQRYFLYFREPSDVRRMAFLVWKYPEKEDDRWIYIPALDLVRRVAASDKRSSFVGSDFTYEDISGRDLSADKHKLLREEKWNNSDCYVIESKPKEPLDYVRCVSWIDKASFLPLKEEYYDRQNELARVFSADRVENIAAANGAAFPTVMKRTMRNVKSGHRTEVTFKSVSFNVGLTHDIFTERYLRRPPSQWVRP